MPTDTPKSIRGLNKFHYYTATYYRGYILYWVILLVLFTGFGALPFIKVDVSIQNRGVITTLNKMVSITSPLTARVVGCSIKENSKVEKGDTLIVLHQSGISNEIKLNENQIELQRSYIDDLSVLISQKENSELKTHLYRKEKDGFTSVVNAYQSKIQKLSIDYDRTAKLFEEGVLPLTSFQEDSFKLADARNELISYRTSTNARWESERRNCGLAIHDLESRIENLRQQQNQYIITAPFAGNIINYSGMAPGHILHENQHIAFLSPQEKLVAECHVSPSDIGFISKGMPVQLQVDTYDYNQWGLLDAEVLDIAEDVVLMNGQYSYLVRCQLMADYLEMKNGVKGSLKKGMSITGRFILTQRSLFQLLFDNIDDWLNPRILPEVAPINDVTQ